MFFVATKWNPQNWNQSPNSFRNLGSKTQTPKEKRKRWKIKEQTKLTQLVTSFQTRAPIRRDSSSVSPLTKSNHHSRHNIANRFFRWNSFCFHAQSQTESSQSNREKWTRIWIWLGFFLASFYSAKEMITTVIKIWMWKSYASTIYIYIYMFLRSWWNSVVSKFPIIIYCILLMYNAKMVKIINVDKKMVKIRNVENIKTN